MATKLPIKNTNSLNYLRIKQQVPDMEPHDPKDKIQKKPLGAPTKWKETQADIFLKPGDVVEVYVGGINRLIIEEMPS